LSWTPSIVEGEGDTFLQQVLNAKPVKDPFALPDVIEKGGRNDTLIAFAGQLAQKGWSAREVLQQLHLTNLLRCKPPLEHAEVEQIYASSKRYVPDQNDLLGLLDFRVAKTTIFASNPPTYHLEIENAGLLRISGADLIDKKRFSLVYHERFFRTPGVPTGEGAAELWRHISNYWLSEASQIVMPPDANPHDYLVGIICDWVISVEVKEPYGCFLENDLAITLPEYGKRKVFRLASLAKHPEIKGTPTNRLGEILQTLGCEVPAQGKKGGGRIRLKIEPHSDKVKQYRVWIAPESLSLEDEIPSQKTSLDILTSTSHH